MQLSGAIPFKAFATGQQLIIRSDGTKKIYYRLYDINGKVVDKNGLLTGEKQITVSVKGVYILAVTDDSGITWTQKIPVY